MRDLKVLLPQLILDLDIDFAMKYFNKAHYYEFLDKYIERHEAVFSAVKECVSGENWQVEFTEASRTLAEEVKAYIKKKFILRRKKLELDYVYSLVCFVIPALMDLRAEVSDIDKACRILADVYSEYFPQNDKLGVATREEIQSGFKLRILGIPVGE